MKRRPCVALIVALDLEERCVIAYASRVASTQVIVQRSGPGRERAMRAATKAIETGATALISFGLAGGLAPGCGPGAVVLSNRVLGPRDTQYSTDDAWCTRIAQVLQRPFVPVQGPMLADGELLADVAAKARAAAKTGAVAVDMESAGIAEVAAAHGLPFICLRAVADGPDDSLPAGIERWIDARGNRRLAPLVDTLVHPSQWAGLCRLGRRSAKARRTLRELAAILGPKGFLHDA